MESARTSDVGGVPGSGAVLLRAAAELRFGRPDLTGALAQHLAETAVAAGDRDGWLRAVGWRIHAVSAIGDGRDAAAEVIEALPHWGADALSVAAADRLRVELAVVALEVGDHGAARALLAAPAIEGGPELVADVAVAAVRIGGGNSAGEQSAALDTALAAWASVGGRRGEVGAASSVLVAAAIARRAGRAARAVSLAVDGLARLDRGRGEGALTPSAHLAAALAAEWISALIDVGRADDAREGSGPVRSRLLDRARPTRQLALLRLTIARAAASDPHDTDPASTASELERAAQDASAADVPELEHVCRTASGELHESQGRLDASLEATRLAVVADRRSRARARRLRAAIAASSPIWGRPATQADRVAVAPQLGGARRPPVANGHHEGNGVGERTAILRAVRAVDVRRPGGPGTAPERGASSERTIGIGSGVAAGPTSDDRRPAAGPVWAGPWVTGSWTGVPDPGPWGTGPSGNRRAGVPAGVAPEVGPASIGATSSGAKETAANETAAKETAAYETAGPSTARTADAEHPAAGTSAEPGSAGRGQEAGRPVPTFAGRTPEQQSGSGPTVRVPLGGAALFGSPATAAADGRSAMADPDTWLATALAELDRIWGNPPAAVDRVTTPVAAEHGGDRGEADSHGGDTGEVDTGAGGCVVVLDLTRAGQRLPAAAAAATVRRVVDRLADRLPPGSRLRDDAPDSVSVVLPGRDRTAASEWMHRVLPGLVDGLAVDDGVAGALLRAAVHDTDGVVGAQILHRLDGARGTAPGPARGAETDRHARNGAPRTAVPARQPAPDDDRADRGAVAGPQRAAGARRYGLDAGADGDGRDGATGGAALASPAGRHDQSADRPPYLPDGVVVRPGSGGRRHRRAPDPAPDPADDAGAAPRSAAPQSTEGLGLADLLAGALAAYRGI